MFTYWSLIHIYCVKFNDTISRSTFISFIFYALVAPTESGPFFRRCFRLCHLELENFFDEWIVLGLVRHRRFSVEQLRNNWAVLPSLSQTGFIDVHRGEHVYGRSFRRELKIEDVSSFTILSNFFETVTYHWNICILQKTVQLRRIRFSRVYFKFRGLLLNIKYIYIWKENVYDDFVWFFILMSLKIFQSSERKIWNNETIL